MENQQLEQNLRLIEKELINIVSDSDLNEAPWSNAIDSGPWLASYQHVPTASFVPGMALAQLSYSPESTPSFQSGSTPAIHYFTGECVYPYGLSTFPQTKLPLTLGLNSFIQTAPHIHAKDVPSSVHTYPDPAPQAGNNLPWNESFKTTQIHFWEHSQLITHTMENESHMNSNKTSKEQFRDCDGFAGTACSYEQSNKDGQTPTPVIDQQTNDQDTVDEHTPWNPLYKTSTIQFWDNDFCCSDMQNTPQNPEQSNWMEGQTDEQNKPLKPEQVNVKEAQQPLSEDNQMTRHASTSLLFKGWIDRNNVDKTSSLEELGITPNTTTKTFGDKLLEHFELAYEYLAELSALRLNATGRVNMKPANFGSYVPLINIWEHFIEHAKDECSKTNLKMLSLERQWTLDGCKEVILAVQRAVQSFSRSSELATLKENVNCLNTQTETDLLIQLLDRVIVAIRTANTYMWQMRTIYGRPKVVRAVPHSGNSGPKVNLRRIG